MISYFTAWKTSPRSVVQEEPESSPTEAKKCCACNEELRKLQQENRQLRQELVNENYRIRELEGAQRSLALFVPSFSCDESSDNVSIEVQPVVSATSSTSTIPTGSAFANEKRKQQQERDDRETLQRAKKIIRKKTASRQSLRYRRNPLVQSSSYERTIADLKVLFRSDSDSSASSSLDHESNDVVIGKNVMFRSRTATHDHNEVSTYVSGYFLRANSADSDTSSTDNDLLFGEI
jgi:hypothetical protein